MHKKTTSIQCAKYGDVLRSLPQQVQHYHSSKRTIKKKNVNELYVYDRSVYVKVESGIIGVVFLDKLDHEPELFAIHKILKIKPKIPFNFVALSQTGIIAMYVHMHANNT